MIDLNKIHMKDYTGQWQRWGSVSLWTRRQQAYRSRVSKADRRAIARCYFEGGPAKVNAYSTAAWIFVPGSRREWVESR